MQRKIFEVNILLAVFGIRFKQVFDSELKNETDLSGRKVVTLVYCYDVLRSGKCSMRIENLIHNATTLYCERFFKEMKNTLTAEISKDGILTYNTDKSTNLLRTNDA